MEEKSNIIHLLNDSVAQFNGLIADLKEEEFEININHKWSAGQDLVHFVKLLKVVRCLQCLGPRFTLKKKIA